MINNPREALNHAKTQLTKPGSQVHWVKLLIAVAGLIALSFLLAFLMNFLKARLNIDLVKFELLAYVSVFAATLLANMTIIAPVPFAVAIMVSAAESFNPLIVAACAALGGTIGELSGYYAGRLGKKIAIPDTIVGYKKLEGWINKYGFWSIAVIAFQPIIPFDVGGLIAGAAKMPIWKFLPALLLGKFPKYILLTYAGIGAIHSLPPWLGRLLGG
jgi:membrane protein YqaA with SNARE-associated domain